MLSFHNPHYHPNLKSTWFAYYSLWLLQLIPTINESSFSLSLSLIGNIFSLPFAWNKTVLWIRANLNSLHKFLGLLARAFPTLHVLSAQKLQLQQPMKHKWKFVFIKSLQTQMFARESRNSARKAFFHKKKSFAINPLQLFTCGKVD
jgi:hypothetical protein